MDKIDTATIEKVLSKPWAADGRNFSDRIWDNKQKLINTLQTQLVQSLVRGQPQISVVKNFAAKMNSSLSNAGRLIATESAYFASLGEKDSIEKLGVKQYEILATLDRRTSEICRHLDGKVFNQSDFAPGITAPPFHCWCRSCTIPHVPKGGLRAARNDKGKTYYVDGGMKYTDWHKVFVEKSMSYEDWEKAHSPQKNNKSANNAKSDKEKIADLVKRVNSIDIKDCTKDDIIDIGKAVNEQFHIDEKLGDKKALKKIFSNFREMGGHIAVEQWAKGSNLMNKALLNEAFSNYPKKWADYLTENDKKLYTLKVERGFFTDGAVMANGKYYATKFSDYVTKYVSIHMSGTKKTTPYHEIGHYVEFFNKEALRISKEFLKARTNNEKPIKLRDLFPEINYRDDEVAKPDDFISPYIGKEYKNASEVLSIGLQSIFEPMKLLKKESFINGQYEKIYATIKNDIEYLYLIIGLIIKA